MQFTQGVGQYDVRLGTTRTRSFLNLWAPSEHKPGGTQKNEQKLQPMGFKQKQNSKHPRSGFEMCFVLINNL